jgi:EPS-associated MarR family transcriptional regulator
VGTQALQVIESINYSLDCHAGGRGFESRPLRHYFILFRTQLHLFKFERRDLPSRTPPCWGVMCWGGGVVPKIGILNSKAKIQEEARFQILRLLNENPWLSQRELSERVGISLGAVNYCLKALIDRGLVKAENVKRNSNKFGYTYVLKPPGIIEKAVSATRFLKRKRAEFEALKIEIMTLSAEISVAEPNRKRADFDSVDSNEKRADIGAQTRVTWS